MTDERSEEEVSARLRREEMISTIKEIEALIWSGSYSAIVHVLAICTNLSFYLY